MTGTHTRTTTQRGLGYRHKKQVENLKAKHIEGTICWWCDEPMYLMQGLDGDHSIPRSQGGTLADRLLHGPCNAQRGDGTRDHLRPALTGKALEVDRQAAELGQRVLRWPS